MKRFFCILLTLMLFACSAQARDAQSSSLPPELPDETSAETFSPEPTPSPTPEPTPAPPDPFTMVWVSDTQTMVVVGFLQQSYADMCDWIANEAESRNFAAYLHTGDMVDNGDNRNQWKTFNNGLEKIAEKMPFFWAVGNHDEGYEDRKPWKEQPFLASIPEEQKYQGGEADYMVLEVGDVRLLLLSVSYRSSYDDAALAWLREAAEAHSDLPAILLVHVYVTVNGEPTKRAMPIEENLVSRCPNIRLILCGHARGIVRTAFLYDDDGDGTPERTVNVLMNDLQADTDRPGYVNLLTYNPADNSLSVTSYSPCVDDEIYDDEHPELERFTIENVF